MEKNDLLLSGGLSFMDEDYVQSVEYFTKVINQSKAPEGYLFRATALIKQGKYQDALKDIEEGEKSVKNPYDFSYKKGICHFYQESFQKAYDCFCQASRNASNTEQKSNLEKWM